MTDERVGAALKVAAQRAGLIDNDWLKIVDTSKVTLEANGEVKGAAELVAALKEAKPFLFPQKMARDLSESERAEALATIIKSGPKPEPMPVVKAKDLTPYSCDRRSTASACSRSGRTSTPGSAPGSRARRRHLDRNA